MLPAVITDFLPAKPTMEIRSPDDWQYRLTIVTIRLVEALLAIIFCKKLAAYFF